jgi:DUF438 domain-containing protein
MIHSATLEAMLDSINHPIVFVDNDHVIRYLNRPARKRYYEQRGFKDLIGRSLFDCHKAASCERIRDIHRRLREGESEVFLTVNENGEHITVVGVRDEHGRLLGYFERFEPVGGPAHPA